MPGSASPAGGTPRISADITRQIFAPDRLRELAGSPAVVCEGRTLTYGGLADLVVRAGTALTAEGLAPGDRVVLQMRDTERLIAGVFGAMHAGLVPVILGRHVSGADLDRAIAETGAPVVVEDEDGSGSAAGSTGAARMSADDLAPPLRVTGCAAPADAAPAREEAFWLYTSGTTGRSKGVVLGHRELAPLVAYHRGALGIGAGTRIFCTSRLAFAYALGNACLAPLALGATIVLHPDWPTPESSLELVAVTRPDVVFSVPSLYRAWLALPERSLAPMRRVRRFVSAGERLPVAISERWQARTGGAILDCYGCSETVFFVFASPASRPKPGSVGLPCEDVTAELRDDAGAPFVGRETGRLFVRHPFAAIGYGPGAGDAAARFSDGWFATGDLFRRDEDGYWHHMGREDDRLKISGRWVSLSEIEEAAQGLDGVDQVAAAAATDPDGLDRVALFAVAASPAAGATLAAALEHLFAERLPPFSRPKWIRVVPELPRTATGKVRKAELRRLIEEETP